MKKISGFIVITFFFISSAWAEISIDINANAKIGGKEESLRGNTRSDENNSYLVTGDHIRLDLNYSVLQTSPSLIDLKVKTYKRVGKKFILWNTSKATALSGHDINLKMSKGKDFVKVLIRASIL